MARMESLICWVWLESEELGEKKNFMRRCWDSEKRESRMVRRESPSMKAFWL